MTIVTYPEGDLSQRSLIDRTTRDAACREGEQIWLGMETFVRRAGFASIVGSILISPLPFLAGLAAPAYGVVLAIILAGAALFIAIQSSRTRLVAGNIFAIAFFLHFAFLVLFAWIQMRFEGGYVLSGDGLMFYQNSVALAAGSLPITPRSLGSVDIGHYLLFATLIRDCRADLFAIQVFDCGLVSLAALLMVDIAPLAGSRLSLALALFTAVFPTLIVTTAFDLWKEPTLLFAGALFLWSTVKVWNTAPGLRQMAFGGLATIALVYLRCTRFYVVAYIECAIVAVAILALTRRASLRRFRPAVILLACAITIAEVWPWSLGWPLTPELMIEQIAYTLQTPFMLHYASGSFGQLNHEGHALPAVHAIQTLHGPTARNHTVIAFTPATPATPAESRSGSRTIRIPINIFRRLYGPFIWILPSRWTVALLFSTDYLLYPGMAIWYVILPFVLVGLLLVLYGATTGREGDFALVALAVFESLYFAQYMAINLSYRHRDIMVPFLMIFAWIGWEHLSKMSWWRRAYTCYWAALGVLAAGHVLARTLLQYR